MSLSTSSSEVAEATEWGRWLGVFLGALALGAAAIFAFVLAIDPYDSGRVGILGIRGVDDASPRTANASRARDPQFDSAVIGNSTGQLLKPSELSGLTGKSFVQLTVPGTGPREQLAIMDFFARQHPQVGALVIVTDASWCQRDPALPMQHPFPFWLYGESTWDYMGRLFSTRALRLGLRRVMVGLGLRPRSAPDGYWDYEKEGPAELAPVIESAWRRRPGARRGEPEFPRGCVAGRRDQEASGRTFRSCCWCRRALRQRCHGRARLRLPKRKPATRHCANWSPAGRAVTSSTIVSTTRSRATARTSWTSAITARLSRARWSGGSPTAFGSAVDAKIEF